MNQMADQLKGLKATMEKPRKTQTYNYTDHFPNLQKLAEIHGSPEAGRMLGLSDSAVSKMIAENKVRPFYEMAAAHLLGKKKISSGSKSIVLKMTEKQISVVIAFLDALGVTYMDLDL